jgi:uncharacterized protein (DUF3084 family)
LQTRDQAQQVREQEKREQAKQMQRKEQHIQNQAQQMQKKEQQKQEQEQQISEQERQIRERDEQIQRKDMLMYKLKRSVAWVMDIDKWSQLSEDDRAGWVVLLFLGVLFVSALLVKLGVLLGSMGCR